jgi:hypothetical protein
MLKSLFTPPNFLEPLRTELERILFRHQGDPGSIEEWRHPKTLREKRGWLCYSPSGTRRLAVTPEILAVAGRGGGARPRRRGPLRRGQAQRFVALDDRDVEAIFVACAVPYLLPKSYL